MCLYVNKKDIIDMINNVEHKNITLVHDKKTTKQSKNKNINGDIYEL
jgi:hypothetical protein